jgi:hypothetical protein
MKLITILAALSLIGCGSETYVERTHTEPVYVQPEPQTVIVHRYDEPRSRISVRAHIEP